MPFEFIQIPANGQGSAKEELNKLLRNGRIESVKKTNIRSNIYRHAMLRQPIISHRFGPYPKIDNIALPISILSLSRSYS